LLDIHVFLGKSGENAGFIDFLPSTNHLHARLTFLAIAAGSRIYRCAFPCAQRRAGRARVLATDACGVTGMEKSVLASLAEPVPRCTLSPMAPARFHSRYRHKIGYNRVAKPQWQGAVSWR